MTIMTVMTVMTIIARFKQWARQIKQDVVAVYFAARNSRTPLPVRCLAILIAAYALSPIDLIPDFIPIIGYLDDLLIVPLGLLLVIRLLPLQVLIDAREKASAVLARPRSLVAAALFIGIWIVCIGLVFNHLLIGNMTG